MRRFVLMAGLLVLIGCGDNGGDGGLYSPRCDDLIGQSGEGLIANGCFTGTLLNGSGAIECVDGGTLTWNDAAFQVDDGEVVAFDVEASGGPAYETARDECEGR